MLEVNLRLGRKKYENRRWFKYSSKPLFVQKGNLRSRIMDIQVVGQGRNVSVRLNLPPYADTVIEGKHIVPKNGRYLSIPMSQRLIGKTPRDYMGRGRFVTLTTVLPNKTMRRGLFYVVNGKPYFFMARSITVPRRDLYDFSVDQIRKYLIPMLDKFTAEVLAPQLQEAIAK